VSKTKKTSASSAYDRRIDAYIAKAAPFAQPILEYVRGVVHETCPDVQETIKWGHPHFDYGGIMCGMSAFKEHCGFGFWRASLILPAQDKAEEGMGSFGRITSVKDLPAKKILAGYIRKAMALNEGEMKVPARAPRVPRKESPTPAYLAAALKKNAAARKTFAAFTPSMRREYIDWLTEAKTDDTRDKRLATTIEWLAAGKQRNWKYQRKAE
jgi:uncharacterized protein YdeI (YjbR/CyaY-like superfamily)